MDLRLDSQFVLDESARSHDSGPVGSATKHVVSSHIELIDNLSAIALPICGKETHTVLKYALKWMRLSCHRFLSNQVRLQLFALAYNLGNFLRRLALPQGIRHWALTTLREKLFKIRAKFVQHARYVTFQMAEVAVP